jgi:hypothetical protein
MRSSYRAAVACAALAGTMLAQGASAATARPCLTRPEVEMLTSFILPPIIESVARKCSPALAPDAFLRTSAPALATRFRTESPVRWDQVQPVIAKVASEQLPANLGAQFGTVLVESLITTTLDQEIAVKDCPDANRLIETLAPLPAANTARLTALLFELGTKDEKSENMPFTICPANAAAR